MACKEDGATFIHQAPQVLKIVSGGDGGGAPSGLIPGGAAPSPPNPLSPGRQNR